MRSWLDRLFNKHKFVRRATLLWAVSLITTVVLRVTEPAVFSTTTAAGAAVVTGVLGLLATVIAFYQWSRDRDDRQD